MRDLTRLNALLDKFEENRNDSLCEKEFKELEWRVQPFEGARKAFRVDGQVINGLRNMSIILNASVNEKAIARGGVDIPIVLNTGQHDEVRLRRLFEFPKKGNAKQPLGPFLGVFYKIMEKLEHDDVDDQSKQQALCLFFLKVFKYATVRLHDAANYYVKALNFGDCSHDDDDHYFSFEKEPYAEFLIWTEYLRKVIKLQLIYLKLNLAGRKGSRFTRRPR